jgi:uncharacterized membrane protein
MKTSKIIAVTVLTVLTFALAGVSVYSFAYAANGATTTYPPNTTSPGPNGYYPNGMMGGNWGGMMGAGDMMNDYSSGYSAAPSAAPNSAAQQSAIFPLVGLAALIGAVATGTGGAAYFLARPKMRAIDYSPTENTAGSSAPQNVLAPYVSVSKTLTPEERKVFDVLVAHDGKYLQKYIRAETGLSRLKTHRIVSRLAERGIVTLEKSGNTNEVHVSSWLQNSNVPERNYNERMRNIEISA